MSRTGGSGASGAVAEGAAPLFRTVPVIAQDPSVREADGRILMARIRIPAEDLDPGPTGYRVQVVDYDASTGTYHGAHDISGPVPPDWTRGDPSIVTSPVFRAHNVYAIVMRTLARFEFALGRRVAWGFKRHQLKVAPAGMLDANAFYSQADEGLVFGSFQGADGRTVHTCLSHDIVAHETTHALLDGLRERFLLPSGPDQAAFHEGFSDVVALLSVFAQREIVRALLRPLADGDGAIRRDAVTVAALSETALVRLAEQMGQEITGVRGDALRSSAGLAPDPGLLALAEFDEPHRRGEIVVAAVLHAFLAAWVDRVLGAMAPDQPRVSVVLVADEGADVADTLATMWIRSIDYLPPCDVVFGDVLSAALTADFEVRPDDSRYRLRDHLRATFRAFGIEPASPETSPEPGVWQRPPGGLRYDRVRAESMRSDADEVFRFLWENRALLGVRSGAYTEVLTVCPCVRVGADGFVLRETVATYYQVARLTYDELRERGVAIPDEIVDDLAGGAATGGEDLAEDADPPAADGAADDATAARASAGERSGPEFAVYGGGTLVFDEYGHLKYHVHNDVFGGRQAERLRYLWQSGALTVSGGEARAARMQISEMHHARALDVSAARRRGW